MRYGLPITKDLFLACIEGQHRGETVEYLRQQAPNLNHMLTKDEAEYCFANEPASQRGEILEIIAQNRVSIHESEWLTYVMSIRDRTPSIMSIGGPCARCNRSRCCMKPIATAVKLEDLVFVKQLIKDGFEFGRSSSNPGCLADRPLTVAILTNSEDLVCTLLEAGADVDAAPNSTHAMTALQRACGQGHFKIVCKLLAAGANINGKARLGYGSTALEAAALTGRLDIVHLLISNNDDLTKLKYDCRRAGKMARLYRQNHIARFLEQHAEALTGQIGRDEVDDVIDNLCQCQLGRKSPWERCRSCKILHATENRWFATLIYATNAVCPSDWAVAKKMGPKGHETLTDIKANLDKVTIGNPSET